MRTFDTETDVTKELEKILTIDGRGRPEKAKMLIKLLENVTLTNIFEKLHEISKRKYF